MRDHFVERPHQSAEGPGRSPERPPYGLRDSTVTKGPAAPERLSDHSVNEVNGLSVNEMNGPSANKVSGPSVNEVNGLNNETVPQKKQNHAQL